MAFPAISLKQTSAGAVKRRIVAPPDFADGIPKQVYLPVFVVPADVFHSFLTHSVNISFEKMKLPRDPGAWEDICFWNGNKKWSYTTAPRSGALENGSNLTFFYDGRIKCIVCVVNFSLGLVDYLGLGELDTTLYGRMIRRTHVYVDRGDESESEDENDHIINPAEKIKKLASLSQARHINNVWQSIVHVVRGANGLSTADGNAFLLLAIGCVHFKPFVVTEPDDSQRLVTLTMQQADEAWHTYMESLSREIGPIPDDNDELARNVCRVMHQNVSEVTGTTVARHVSRLIRGLRVRSRSVNGDSTMPIVINSSNPKVSDEVYNAFLESKRKRDHEKTKSAIDARGKRRREEEQPMDFARKADV